MKTLTLSLIVCLLPGIVGGCTPTYTGPTPEQIAKRREQEAAADRVFEESRRNDREQKQQITNEIEKGTAALKRYQQGDHEAAKQCVAHVFKLANMADVYTFAGTEPEGHMSRDGHTALAFALAKSALERGHLDAADMIYRHLIEVYSGFAYAGIRERARIGLEDVQAAR